MAVKYYNSKSEIVATRRRSKYGNIKTTINGITFDSKGEAELYNNYRMLEKAGLMKIIDLQPLVYLTRARILYKPDFLILEKDEKIWVDFKGKENEKFPIKRRLWKHYGPGKLRIVKRVRGQMITKEEIESIGVLNE